MTVYVTSIDFDDCISTQKEPASLRSYIETNQLLINFIQQNQSDKKIMLVGSNRQSLMIDLDKCFSGLFKGKKAGSCYTAIDYISKQVGAEFDPFTLSDIFLDKLPGYSVNLFLHEVHELFAEEPEKIIGLMEYTQITEKNPELKLQTRSPAEFLSEDKINVLYAQMQKVAIEHPNDEISFDFFDDRSDILDSLNEFFRAYPSLIAKNITLRLFQYQAGHPPELAHEAIHGTGEIDYAYYQTVKNMCEITKNTQYTYLDGSTLLECVTPERLGFKSKEKTSVLEVTTSDRGAPTFFQPASLQSYVPASGRVIATTNLTVPTAAMG